MYFFTEKMQRLKMGFPDYIQALEEERRKIQVFCKELPLSFELVTQAIEACRQQLSGTTSEYNLNGQSECSERTTSSEGPVLEEFIPIKKRASSSPCCDEDDEDYEQHSLRQTVLNENNNNSDKRKSDWLRSVQLWNPDPPAEEDATKKVPGMELKRSGSGGGAFQPFHREERATKETETLYKAPSSTRVPAASSSAGELTPEKNQNEGQRKQRRCWSQDLHKRFLHALQQLGGADSATPKQIRELMNVDGLTNDEVKSHLQKYRLHTRRPSPLVHNNSSPQAAPFVLVGNIFVQSPEYAAVATSTASREVTTVTVPAGVYAPVATHPKPVSQPSADSIKKPQFKKFKHSEHSNSDERGHHSEGAVHSNSPTSSSSTHTSASPGY
ncbi:transcription factor HHO3-like isoform X1 [Vigna umbellata]|uniref:transcription factor HHO3-like isoform X1 n=2 Tax=Vigna umbellata TaxID=87088 RepID=UPI001F5F6200|nr:transcription factor HHO3-like isoform X1 [Vigna umbellata]